MIFLAIDTEGGGIGPNYSLLSAYFAVFRMNDDGYDTLSSLSLLLKPDEINGKSEYLIQGEALRVNGINIGEHDLNAIQYKEAKPIIYNWLNDNFGLYDKLVPIGHGVQRDIELITKYTISEKSWINFVDPRVIDTISLCKFAQAVGFFPEGISISLSKIVKSIGIEIDEKLIHTAEYDVTMNIELFNHLYRKL